MEGKRTRASREEWRKRVGRWQESSLTAAEFAAETGLNARTLTYWKYMFSKEGAAGEVATTTKVRGERAGAKATPIEARSSLPLVEIHAASPQAGTAFELELRGGRRLHVPSSFDAVSLRRLLGVLEERA